MSDTIKDRMRADLARVLRMDPSEIGDEDDLVDLGLDSMRTMSLLTEWDRAGIAPEFAAMAEKATLSHWAELAARGGKAAP